MRVQRGVDHCLNTFQVVLQHLDSTDGSEQACHTAAKALHLAAAPYRLAARGTLRHLHLDKYYGQTRSHRKAPIPWDLLQASTAATSWSVHAEQLRPVARRIEEQLSTAMAATAQLKRLKVYGTYHPAMQLQPAALGRLLGACSQLEELDLSCLPSGLREPWLLLDPGSASISTAKGPALPLRSLRVGGMPPQLVTGWLGQQQQQFSHTLQQLEVTYNGDDGELDVGQLTGLVGLRDLQLSGVKVSAPTHLGSMPGLTQLKLSGCSCSTAAVEAACTLTNLRHLSVGDELLQTLPDGMRALKQLTCLSISNSSIQQLSVDLGLWCPGLVGLEAHTSQLAAVPASLRSLTRLGLAGGRAAQLVLPTTLTRLKELDLSDAMYATITGISSLTALEWLDASQRTGSTLEGTAWGAAMGVPEMPWAARPLGGSLAALPPLTRLRHLNLSGTESPDWGNFSVTGAMQHLTHLNLSSMGRYSQAEAAAAAAGWAALAGTEPLPALQQLDLSFSVGVLQSSLVLGPWIGRMAALTQLKVGGSSGQVADEHQHLPPQLEELSLEGGWLSNGVRQLSALRVLDLSNSFWLTLPMWLSELRSLDELDLQNSCGHLARKPRVLTHMPWLRCVKGSQDWLMGPIAATDSDGGDDSSGSETESEVSSGG